MRHLTALLILLTVGACASPGPSPVVGKLPPSYDTFAGLYIDQKGLVGERAKLVKEGDFKVGVTTLQDFHVVTGLTSTPIARTEIRREGKNVIEHWATYTIGTQVGTPNFVDVFSFHNGVLQKIFGKN